MLGGKDKPVALLNVAGYYDKLVEFWEHMGRVGFVRPQHRGMLLVSDDLDAIRADLAEAFRGSLTAQDAGGWRPHVTIQNKVAPKVARALLEQLDAGFAPRPLAIKGIGLHRYLGGPWERIAAYNFRGR